MPFLLASSSIAQALSNGFNSFKSDVLGYIISALPVAITIFGAVFCIVEGVKLFLRLSGRID